MNIKDLPMTKFWIRPNSKYLQITCLMHLKGCFFDKKENIVGNGENAGYFLLFQQYFPILLF